MVFSNKSFLDACPCNGDIYVTDFRAIKNISMGDNSYGQGPPIWQFRDEGKEIFQELNSSPGIAIGEAKLSAVEFEGTIFVTCCADDDWLGAIFSFQVKFTKG